MTPLTDAQMERAARELCPLWFSISTDETIGLCKDAVRYVAQGHRGEYNAATFAQIQQAIAAALKEIP